MGKYKQIQVAAGRVSGPTNNLLAGMVLALSTVVSSSSYASPLSYAHDVQPIIKANCLQCHQPGGEGYERSGLDMRTYKRLMKGTKFGSVIVPGDSFDSTLIELIEHRANASINMPFHKSSLTKGEIEKISKWIDEGAKP